MKILRPFFAAFFAILGAAIALLVVSIGLYFLFNTADEKTFSSDVKILPDAEGNRKKLSSSTPIILQLTIDGTIGKEKLTGAKIEEMLLDSREDAFEKDRVKAILLVINSPGGGVNDSDIIYRHLKAYKARYNVPIYTYVNGLCASGGYYIACASDQIYASDVSLIGSIGVVSWPPFMNVVDTLEKVGVEALTLSAGKGKDAMNPFRPWKEGEEKHRQGLLDYFYGQFVALVSEDRGIDTEDLKEKIEAKVYPAPEAVALGLIDESGASREQALCALAEKAGIEGAYQVVGFESKTWWKKAFNQDAVKHEISLPSVIDYPVAYR